MLNLEMKKINPLKSLLFVLIMLFSSCNENETTQPEPISLVSITITAGFAQSNDELYGIVSRRNGEIINHKKINVDEKTDFTIENFTETTVMFSLIKINGGTISIETFDDLPLGLNLTLKGRMENGSLSIKASEFDQNFALYSISTHGDFNFYFGNNEQYTFKSSEYPTPLFISRVNNESEPDGFIYQPIIKYSSNTNETPLTINLSGIYAPSVYTPYSFETFNIGSDIIPWYVDLFGYNTNESFSKAFFVGSSEIYDLENQKVFFPGSTFSHYASFSIGYTNDMDYIAFNLNSKHDFDIPNFTYQASFQNNEFTYQSTLTNGYITTWLDGNENLVSWVIHSDLNNNSISLPEIPLELINRIDGYQNSEWTFTNQIQITTFGNSYDLEKLVSLEFESGVSLVDLNINYKRYRMYLGNSIRVHKLKNRIKKRSY